MAKVLTPARICTLILLEIYYSESFWTYTPQVSHTILKVVSEQCLLDTHNDSPIEPESTQPEICRSVLEYGARLSSLETDIPGRSWLSVLLAKLWTITSFDDFHDIFERCSLLLIDPEAAEDKQDKAGTITRASPVGQFIRRCNVGFAKMQFSDVMTLWNAFVVFREPSRSIWHQHHPEAIEADITTTAEVVPDTAFVDTDRVESLLNKSVSRLQKLGHRVPEEVRSKLKEWLRDQQAASLQSLQHFMSFFDAWKAGQYNVALENLHRYFDYSIARGGGDEVKLYYQYALLHLSVLHADFDHWEESVSAMKECITTARENQDTACLNFALSWLMYLRQSRQMNDRNGLRSLAAIAGEGGNGQDELAFLKAKAKDSKHWTLLSSTLLEEAKYEMRHFGVSVKTVECVLQSSYLNTQHAAFSVMPSNAVFQAAIYDRLSQSDLVQRIHDAALTTLATHCSLSDQVRIRCRFAYHSAQNGSYSRAISDLEKIRMLVRGNLKLEQRVTAFGSIVAMNQAVRRSDLRATEYHMSNLRAFRGYGDLDIVALIDQVEIALLVKQNQIDVALKKVNSLLTRSKAEVNGDIAETLRLLVEKAKLFAAAGHPLKGFSIVLRAATTAERCHLVGVLVEALAVIANILNELGDSEGASQIAEATLPFALEGADASLTARLFVVLGEANVGMISKPDQPQSKQIQHARTALVYIERGRQVYAKLEEHDGQLECLVMKSEVASWMGDATTADQADSMHSQLVARQQDQLRT